MAADADAAVRTAGERARACAEGGHICAFAHRSAQCATMLSGMIGWTTLGAGMGRLQRGH